jgi:hypothetical protein
MEGKGKIKSGQNDDPSMIIEEAELLIHAKSGQPFLKIVGTIVDKKWSDHDVALFINVGPSPFINHGSDSALQKITGCMKAGLDDNFSLSVLEAPYPMFFKWRNLLMFGHHPRIFHSHDGHCPRTQQDDGKDGYLQINHNISKSFRSHFQGIRRFLLRVARRQPFTIDA